MIPYFVADAFADKLFEGNPAGVCVLDRWLPDETMRMIAMENNLSETGFVVKEGDAPCTYGLRWFTPVDEIDLCGHCTFGSAYILFRFVEQRQQEIHFNAHKCGYHLVVSREGDILTMAFPVLPPERYQYADYMGEGVGAVPAEVWRTERDLLLVYDSDETVRDLRPDFGKLKEFPVGMSVYVTARSSDPRYDIVARAFWPKINVNEDPVCGSMHCTLMPFWKERLGKDEIVSRSVSRRGGTIVCRQKGDTVLLSGHGAFYSRGELNIEESITGQT